MLVIDVFYKEALPRTVQNLTARENTLAILAVVFKRVYITHSPPCVLRSS